MKYRTEGNKVTVFDGLGNEMVSVEGKDAKEAKRLRDTAVRDGWEAITPEGLATATKAEAEREKARVEKGKKASEPKK